MRRTLKRVAVIVACAAILALPMTAFAEFWGSADSKKYHNPKCKAAQSIKKENLVKFATPEVAKKLGFEPCDICKPPVK